jgi:hypothetical protein
MIDAGDALEVHVTTVPRKLEAGSSNSGACSVLLLRMKRLGARPTDELLRRG